MEAPEPFLEPPVVGVHVVDVIFRRLRDRGARRGQDVDFELGAPRECRDGRPPIAAKWRRGGDDPTERGRETGGVEPGQDRVDGRARPVARDDDGDLFFRKAALDGLASPLARGSGKTFMKALERFQNECLIRFDYAR